MKLATRNAIESTKIILNHITDIKDMLTELKSNISTSNEEVEHQKKDVS